MNEIKNHVILHLKSILLAKHTNKQDRFKMYDYMIDDF